jgi:hypothetical protein
MGQANLQVSIDAKGNLVCPDITGKLGESITWTPDGTSVASIQSITATIGSFNPVPSAANNWTGSFATDGVFRGGELGLEYTIVVNPTNPAVGQKQKSPKITVSAPEPVK